MDSCLAIEVGFVYVVLARKSKHVARSQMESDASYEMSMRQRFQGALAIFTSTVFVLVQ